MPDIEYNCPICHRMILRTHENGTFDLAGKAKVGFKFDFMAAFRGEEVHGIVDPETAACNRLICKIKRLWRKKEKP